MTEPAAHKRTTETPEFSLGMGATLLLALAALFVALGGMLLLSSDGDQAWHRSGGRQAIFDKDYEFCAQRHAASGPFEACMGRLGWQKSDADLINGPYFYAP